MRLVSSIALVLAVAGLTACSDADNDGGADAGDGDSLTGADGLGGDGSGNGSGDGSGDNDGSGGGSNGPNDTANPPNFVPDFPGAGTGDAAEPLVGGMLCDTVSDGTIAAVQDTTRCFFGPDDKTNPAATIEQVLECVDGVDVLHLRLTFDPSFVDNTFGSGSVGWGNRGHTNDKDLVKSDHAELLLIDGDGEVALQFKMDFIELDPDAESGYSNACVTGGDGEVIVGDPDAITMCMTSLDRNLNERGYDEYGVDSPATDEDYTPNPDTPEWDYRIVYEVWIDADAFGDAGFAGAFINYVHASPSKAASDLIDVTPGECPPCVPAPDAACADPDGPGSPDSPEPTGGPDSPGPCSDGNPDTTCPTGEGGPGGDDPACGDGNPDTFCSDTDAAPDGPPAFCELYPTDPACKPE